jgi:hypothetical protein
VRITIDIDPSWASIPVALSRVLLAVAALERPRQPGDDGEVLAELLDGIDIPEPAPAAASAAPKPLPSAAREAARSARSFDGISQTGSAMYRWAAGRKMLPDVSRVGAELHYPKRISEWEPGMVATVFALMTTEQPANGQAR